MPLLVNWTPYAYYDSKASASHRDEYIASEVYSTVVHYLQPSACGLQAKIGDMRLHPTTAYAHGWMDVVHLLCAGALGSATCSNLHVDVQTKCRRLHW